MSNQLPAPFVDRLAELAHMLRKRPGFPGPEWRVPGIKAAIERMPNASPADIAVAVLKAADDPSMRTPDPMSKPGLHWTGTAQANVKPPTMCADHPDERAATCPHCRTQAATRPPGWLRAAAERAKTDAEEREQNRNTAQIRAREEAQK